MVFENEKEVSGFETGTIPSITPEYIIEIIIIIPITSTMINEYLTAFCHETIKSSCLIWDKIFPERFYNMLKFSYE